jgi:hypothetical protein
MTPTEKDDQFDEAEGRRRFEAALRGARAAAAQPLKDIPPKRRGAKNSKQRRPAKEE